MSDVRTLRALDKNRNERQKLLLLLEVAALLRQQANDFKQEMIQMRPAKLEPQPA